MSVPLKNIVHSIIYEDLVALVHSDFPWRKLAGKTVLITGANGFLPSYQVYLLLALNDILHINVRVIALVRNKEKAVLRFGPLLERKDIQLLVQDVAQPIAIDEPIHFCIHAASQASPKFYKTDPVGTLNANVLGTHHLLSLARAQKIESFLFVSSGEVYGQINENQVPTKENEYGYIDILDVRSCYSEAKRVSETMSVSWFHQYGVPAKIVRPFHTYGPGLDINDGRVYADFVADMVLGRNIIMKSDGSAKRAFCYIADATLGFFTVLLKGENGKAYNVGNSGQEYSILQLAETLCTLFPEKNLKVVRDDSKKEKDYLKSPISRNSPDTSALETLGWKPWTTIEAGFLKTIMFTNDTNRN